MANAAEVLNIPITGMGSWQRHNVVLKVGELVVQVVSTFPQNRNCLIHHCPLLTHRIILTVTAPLEDLDLGCG